MKIQKNKIHYYHQNLYLLQNENLIFIYLFIY